MTDQHLPLHYLADHLYFPEDLILDKSFTNTVTVRGKPHSQPPKGPVLSLFQEDVVIQVALSYVTTIEFVSDSYPATRLGDCLGVKSNHVHILTLPWAYILGWMGGTYSCITLPTYNNHQDQLNAAK